MMAYRPGSSLTASAEEIARRNGISPALATSKEARAAAPLHPEPPAIKGAVKVAGFPVKTRYPFQQIADDGGVWKLDPAEFGAKPQSVRQAAITWATKKDMTTQTAVDDGMVFVQFTRRPA
jgi:hypothetical protein